jgi:spore coat protein U-like protein
MKLKQSILAAAMLVAAAVPMQAQAAGFRTTTMVVDATIVIPTVTLTTTPINFGTVLTTTGTPTATGSIIATVTATVPYKISINSGLHTLQVGTCRRMHDTAGVDAFLYQAYDLFTDASHTIPWGDSDLANTCAGKTNNGGASFASTGTGSAQTFTVYAQGSYSGISAGTVSDTLTVTLTY